jgi:hypothetical protein
VRVEAAAAAVDLAGADLDQFLVAGGRGESVTTWPAALRWPKSFLVTGWANRSSRAAFMNGPSASALKRYARMTEGAAGV